MMEKLGTKTYIFRRYWCHDHWCSFN